MNSGSFFKLDLETSKVVEGIAFYDYLDVPDLRNGTDSIEYPIRVSISSDCVSFFIHYFEEYADNSIDDVERPHHAEETILSLSFGSEAHDGLSSQIKHIYNTSFPISSYLRRLLEDRYVTEYKKDTKIDWQRGYTQLRDSKVNRDSYSSLYLWGLLKKEGIAKERIVITRDTDNCITKFLRKLLLDFMFDLMHSDVFETSKYYSQMRTGLMNDFFFSSIVKKSEYYYNRRLVRNSLQSIIDEEGNLDSLSRVVRQLRKQESKRSRKLWLKELFKTLDKDSLKKIEVKHSAAIKNIEKKNSFLYNKIIALKDLYAEKLDTSEAEWIEVIMSPWADKHFSFSPEWYEDQRPSKKRKGFSVSESWFVHPEEEMARLSFPLEDDSSEDDQKKKGDIHYLNSYELGCLIGTGKNSSSLARNTRISKWFYRRFDFSDTFRMHFSKSWNQCFSLLLLAFVVAAMVPEFWISPRNIALFPGIAAIAFILFSLFGFCRKEKSIDCFLMRNRNRRERWRAFKLSLCFGAIGAALYFYHSSEVSCVLTKLFALIGVFWISLYAIKPRVHIIDNIHLFLPRLVASITTAWIMIVIGNDLVKEELSRPVCVILSIIVFAFILYESNKSLPNLTRAPRVWRALEMMLISFSISLIIGIFAVNVLSPSLVQDATGYKINLVPITWEFLSGSKELTLSIFPKYLVRFSFLAMFIGVFIQMIFEEKSITEM